MHLNISSLSRREISEKGSGDNVVYPTNGKKSRGKWVGGQQISVTRAHAWIHVLSFSVVGTYDLSRSPGTQCQVHRSTLVLRVLTHSARFLFHHNYASCAKACTTTFVSSCNCVSASRDLLSGLDRQLEAVCLTLSSFPLVPTCVTRNRLFID